MTDQVDIDDPSTRERMAVQKLVEESVLNRHDHATLRGRLARVEAQADDTNGAVRALGLPGVSTHITVALYLIAFFVACIAGELLAMILS